ncbi:MAG: carboxypeptidase-like regulatory domain-containing protein [Ferruginibacter sp.]
MNHIPPFKRAIVFLPLLVLMIFWGCQKELSSTSNISIVDTPADLTSKATVSMVSGFVTDENNAVVKNADVKMGNVVTTTDRFGYFEIRNVEVIKNAAFVSVTYPGYFKGFKTFIANDNEGAFFRIKLVTKPNSGSINATAGGNVVLSNGLAVALPANGIVTASTGAAYTGIVKVAASWLNPDATDINDIMPGDLRGINSNGAIKMLQTYGMADVELTGASGELLQVASGKKATLTFPLPASLTASAPISIPLWYFDETNGLWKQDGAAVKTGNAYVGDVSHFSCWNCDLPLSNAVRFDLTVVDSLGNPLQNADVAFIRSNGDYTGCHGYTDSAGHVSGSIPANSSLVFNIVFAYSSNSAAVYSKAVNTNSTDISLGTVKASNTATYTADVSGIALDCGGQPVSNGYAVLQFGSHAVSVSINSSGIFHLSTTIPCGNNIAKLSVVDFANKKKSITYAINLNKGLNDVGSMNTCSSPLESFMVYTVNGTLTALAFPAQFPVNGFPANSMDVAGIQTASNNLETGLTLQIDSTNIRAGSVQDLIYLESTQTSGVMIPTYQHVNITEYGNVGQYISGNFTGTVVGFAAPHTSFTMTCSFRVKRQY